MAEFQANAETMVGNNSGSCLLHLTGAAITIKFPLTGDSASWPYNCIRQFRADEDTRQFSFFSGRRGPYGVAEYKFDMTERMLLEMQDALTQFTGAQFGQNPTPGTGSGNGFAPESVRSPKRDPLPQVPGTPPTNQETHAGYTTHQANFQQKQTTANIFGTLPPRYRQESLSSRPPVPAPYDSHTMGSRGRQGSPSINTKYSYHEVTGGFPPGAERGVGFSGSTVPGPIISGRKMSHGDEVFSSKTMSSPVRNGKLMRQATAPTHRLKRNFEENESPTQSGVFSPPPAVEPADGEISSLDFGGLLRRSSPQVDRKNTTRRGRTSPPDSSPRHDMYNVPRPTDSTHSPPPPASDALYQVPRSDPLSQESAEVPTSFAVSPTQKDNVYSVPKPLGNGVAGDLYSAPRPHRQQSREETPTTPDTGGSVIYNVPSSRPAPPQQQQQLQQQSHVQMVRPTPENGHELYNTPRAVVAHDPYNSPQPVSSAPVGTPQAPQSASQTPQSGHELYNVPRAVGGNTQDEDNGLYNVPRSVDAQTELYNVPKPAARQGSYDSLQSVQNSAEYQASKPGGNPTTAGPPHHRKPIPTPEQETYSVPRSANPPSSPVGSRRGENNGRRYPYDYVDHRLQKGTLKSSRSLESLVRHRVSLSPDAPSQQSARAQRTPSPRALKHKYIEIDIDEFTDSNSSSPSGRGRTRQQMHTRPENMYAEISDTESTHHRGSHPGNTSTLPAQAHSYQHTNGAAKPANNTTPLPLQQGRMYLSQSTNAGLDGVSKEARALHEDGYELVLPADDAARNVAMKQQKQATLPMTINRAQSVSAYNRNPHRVTNGVHPVIGEDTNTSVLGTSNPHSHRPTTDEYVIVNRREFNTPTQPRDIPVPLPQTSHGGASSHALNVGSSSGIIVEDEYEIMSSVNTTRPPQFSMASSVPSKKWGSVSTSNGSPGIGSMSRGSQQSARDSLDLESVETGSRASVGSGGHPDELVGPLSPIDAGALQIRHSGPARPNVVRLASGSPHDLSSSKELKFRSNAMENILDGDEKNQKYENVTDEDIAAKHALSVSHHLQLGEESAAHVGSGAHRKPPMPLPRTARPEH